MELHHQYIVDRLNNRHREDLPPLFWLAVVLVCMLLTSNVMAADARTVIDILECESSGIHNKRSRSGKHYGIAMFREDTFKMFVRLGGFPKNYYRANPIHQMRVLNWALDHGYGNHWQCLPVMDSVRAEK